MSNGPPDTRPGRLLAWLEARFNLTEIVSLLSSFGLFPGELDTRRPVREALDEALRRPIPSYARWPRVLGILSFVLFLFLGLTGMLLTFYYQPTAGEAHASLTAIVRDVNFGWFVNQSHRWAAHLFLAILLLRIGRFFLQGLHRPPREAIWMLAVLLLLAGTVADMTGRLLSWDARGYWSTVRALEVIDALPVLGPLFEFLVGGARIDSLVLTRFYVLHVVILPVVLIVLFYFHFSGVRRVGLTGVPAGGPAGRAAHAAYLYDLLILVVVIFGILITCATLWPVPYGPAADPAATPPGVRPAWYVLAPHALLESFPSYVPARARGAVLLLLMAGVLFVPFLDRSPAQAPGRRRLALALGFAAALLWLLFTWLGWRLEGTP
jgi:quinol-cytochrome oxidoreductase complex cytochrome b subunit